MKTFILFLMLTFMFTIGMLVGERLPVHKWQIVSECYYPGSKNVECSFCNAEDIHKLLLGTTIIRYRCSKDGEEKVQEFIGDVR